MKSLFLTAAILTASSVPALASNRVAPKDFIIRAKRPSTKSCDLDDDLCATCDGGNVTDSGGQDWAVSCGWAISSQDEDSVGGINSPKICMEACDEVDDCWAVNMAVDGSCKLVTGDPKGLKRSPGFTALVRLPASNDEPKPTSTSRVKITTTIYAPGVTRTSRVSITSTTRAAPAQTSSSQCNLGLSNLCPQCDGAQVDSEDGTAYKAYCDQDLYSDSSYSPQEWMSPAECLAECDKFDWCMGIMYYDERNCELAKGDNVFPISKADYTAFLPVPTRPIAAAATSPSAFPTIPADKNYTSPSSSAEPMVSILPINPGCDLENLSCPACDGMPYVDKLNASYTVICGVQPDCISISKFREGADDQKQCLQSCDQDVVCLGVMWYPESSGCHSCRQGMELDPRSSEKLPYVLLIADIDGDDDDNNNVTTSTTTTRRSTAHSTSTFTLVPPTSRSITDLPRPFTTSTRIAPGPVGPVIVSSMPTTSSAPRISPGGPIFNATTKSVIHLSTSSLPATITNIAAVSCPASNHSVYVVPDSGNYFAVNCDNMFTAAHSRYTTATDFAACAAICTGRCDGIQFGYVTRCGLYTDISVVGSAAGWTVAASITFPVEATATPTIAASSSQRRYSNSTVA